MSKHVGGMLWQWIESSATCVHTILNPLPGRATRNVIVPPGDIRSLLNGANELGLSKQFVINKMIQIDEGKFLSSD